MKRFYKWIIIGICMLSLTSCVQTMSGAQKGAGIGALSGMAGSALGKGDRNTTLLLGGAGAILGYMLGNEIDKNNHIPPAYQSNRYQQPQRHTSMYGGQQQGYNEPRTDCQKVTVRNWVNGQLVETIEERCEGRKTTYRY